MTTLMQISDLHFGPHYIERVGEALLRQAAELAPDAIVVSGDLTHRATPDQFAAARRFLDALPPAPRVVVPGNHDVPLYRVWERLTAPYREYLQHIGGELQATLCVPGVRVVALNSTSPYRAITNGRLTDSHLNFCAREFQDSPAEELKVVVAHHHFAPPPDYERSRPMPGAKRALALFQRLGVDLIMGGHLHRAYIGNSLDIFPGLDREHGLLIVQSGTSTSRRGRVREREKNSFNLVEVHADRLVVVHLTYFSEFDRFAPTARHTYPRRPAVSLSAPSG